MKLTKTVVENAELPKKGQRFLWDSELKGFGVRLTPTGRAYVAQSRVKGVDRRVSLGKHGVITLQEARRKAKTALSDMVKGLDPVVEKKREEAYSLTLKQLSEKYLDDRRDLKTSSREDIEKHIKTSFSSWSEKPVMEITRDKVAVRFRELTERGPAQSNQAFRILRALLNYARAAYRPGNKPMIVENPVQMLSDAKLWNRVKPRSGRIPTDKIGAAWNVLQALRQSPGQSTVARTLADAVSFLLFTGARWSEMAELTWEQVNLDEKWWHVEDTKNRSKVTFPLSEIAVKILTERPRAANPYVFPARSGGGHVADARSVVEKITEAAGVHVTAHDLRRTFRAIAGEIGIDLWKTKLLMGHKLSGDVTITHYTETEDLRYLGPEIEKIADWITRQGLIAGSDKVVPIRRIK
jgi:integrase